jgi:glycosyltransferase involved in cell wall biosynthesis
MFFRKGDGIITISETVKKQLQNISNLPIYNLGENIALEYKDADNHVNEHHLEKWNLAPNGYYISVSTIEPRKNIEYLLEVLIPFLKEHQRKLVLVGRKGWGKNKKLQQMIEEAEDFIIFTDYVMTKELFSLYHYAYAFALLSIDEGFGRTPFEAVACGCKRIILSDIEIFRETFDGNALFLPLFDIKKAQSMMSEVDNHILKNNLDLPYDVVETRIKELKW